nr:heparin lyase I family protein [Rhizobium leguminosarum]
MLAFAWHPKGCAREDGSYDRDGSERSELWEAEKILAPIGTDLWYRFDMFIDDSITPTTGRFVIGQWKQTNSPKDAPVLAQRFNGRAFTVSLEQDNADPDRDPKNVLCRVFIASQETAPVEPGFGEDPDIVDRTRHRRSRPWNNTVVAPQLDRLCAGVVGHSLQFAARSVREMDHDGLPPAPGFGPNRSDRNLG